MRSKQREQSSWRRTRGPGSAPGPLMSHTHIKTHAGFYAASSDMESGERFLVYQTYLHLLNVKMMRDFLELSVCRVGCVSGLDLFASLSLQAA